MALNKKTALSVTGHFDTVAAGIEKNAAAWGIPTPIAQDFVRKIDVLAGIIEANANVRRDKEGNLLDNKGNVVTAFTRLAAEWPPEEIGREDAGPLEGDSDEPYMKGEFTQQEKRELSDLQEGGNLAAPSTAPRNPTPGKQALDASLAKLSKLASESEIHSLGGLSTNLKMCSARLKGSGLGNLGGLAGNVSKVADVLDKIQKQLIDADADGGMDILAAAEAAGAINAVEEIQPYLEELSFSVQGIKAGSSPTAQLAAEEYVKGTEGKLSRLVALATTIVTKCDKKIAALLKVDTED